MARSKVKLVIKNSVVVFSDEGKAISKEIGSFDLSDKTPIDCMDFIRKLKHDVVKEDK